MSSLRNIKKYLQCVRQNKGILETDQVQYETKSAPADSNLAVGRMYCDGSTIYGYNGTSWVDMMTTSTINIDAWETLYAADKSLAITGDTLTFAGAHASNNVFTLTNASGSGVCLQITNSGSGDDIQGTSDTWNITKAGVITATGLTMVDSQVITLGTGSDATIQWDTAKLDFNAAAINFDGDTTVEAGHALIVSGTAGSDVLTVTAGDVVLSDTSITLTDADEAVSLSITNDTAAAVNVVEIQADAIAAGGVLLHLDSLAAGMSTGLFFECYDGASSAFTIGLYGATTIAGNAATQVFTITAGDAVMSDGSLAITDADDADTFTVTNDTAAANGMVVFAGAGTYTGNTTSAFVAVTPTGLTTGTAQYIGTDTITTGKFLHLAQAGEAITSGEMFTVVNTESGTLAAKTGNLVSVTSSLEETAGTVTSDYDVALFSRTDKQNFAAQGDAQGSVVKISKALDKTLGTLVDAVIGLEVVCSVANAALPLGDLVQFTGVGVGAKTLDVVSASVGVDDVLITSSGAHTNGFAGLHVTTSGDLATGGANLILTVSGAACNAAARAFEIDAQKDVQAVYIDTDGITNDAVYITHSGNLAAGKSVMHVTDAGIPAADNVYVGHFAFAGTATAESVVLFADGGGKDVTGLYVDCDCVDTAANLSAQVALYSDAAGNLPVLIQTYHQDAGAGDGEIQARFNFYGSNDNATPAKNLYAKIEVASDDVTDTSEDGSVTIFADLASTITASAVFTGNQVALGAAAATLTTNGAWDLTISTAKTAANEPRIVLTDGAAGNITVTAGGTSGEIDLASPVLNSSTQSITGAGTINATTSITELDSTGGGAYGLDDGVEGQIKYIIFKTDPGTDAVITPTSFGSGSTITFADAGDGCILLFTNSTWYCVANNGGTIA